MKKILTIFSLIIIAVSTQAQVGINTEAPQVTLDVKTKKTELEAEGIIAPWLSLNDIIDRKQLYTGEQKGAIVFLTDTLGLSRNKGDFQKIDAPGYYYWDGNEWLPFNSDSNKSNVGIWYDLNHKGYPSPSNTTNSYLNAKVAIGSDQAAKINNDRDVAQLTVNGGDASINGLTVGRGGDGAKAITSTAVGTNALGNYDHSGSEPSANTAVGYEANANNTKANTTALGYRSEATGSASVSVGSYANASGLGAIAIGGSDSKNGGVQASENFAIAIGLSAQAKNTNAVAIGLNTLADGSKSIALGADSRAKGNGVAVGANALALGGGAIAIGSGDSTSVSENYKVKAIGNGSIAIGLGTNSTGRFSAAIGNASKATADGAFAIGVEANNNIAYSNYLKGKTRIGGLLETSYDSGLTLDVLGTPDNKTVLDGMRAPMITLKQLNQKGLEKIYSSVQNGAIIYVTNVDEGTNTSQEVDVKAPGYYYFDSNIVPGGKWVKLASGIERRRNSVKVSADGSGDYTKLQDAYVQEARKLYNQYGSNEVNFICIGNVGGLTAEGGIPKIKIEGGGNAVIEGITLYGGSIFFSGKIDFNGKSIVEYGTNTTIYGGELSNIGEFTIDHSTFKLLYDSGKSQKSSIQAQCITLYNSLMTTSGESSIEINGNYNENSYNYGFSASANSSVIFAEGLKMNINSEDGIRYGLFADDNSAVQWRGSGLYFNKKYEYDIYSVNGSVITFSNGRVGGEGETDIFAMADSQARITFKYKVRIDVPNIRSKGLGAMSGGSIIIDAISNQPDQPDYEYMIKLGWHKGPEYGLYASGGTIRVTSLNRGKSRRVISVTNVSENVLYSDSGGYINTLGGVDYTDGTLNIHNIPLQAIQNDGSVIYNPKHDDDSVIYNSKPK